MLLCSCVCPCNAPLSRPAAQSSTPPDWNFYKYLVDHTGKVTHVWGPKVTVPQIFPHVQQAVDAAWVARGGGDLGDKPSELTRDEL